MLEFATTKLGRRFLADVTRISEALEAISEPRATGPMPSVQLMAGVGYRLEDPIPELGVLRLRLEAVEVTGGRVTFTYRTEEVGS